LRGLFRDTLVFLLGFGFGLATLTTFRHEIDLTSQTRTVLTLIIAGALLTVTVVVWLMRLRNQSQNIGQRLTQTPEWAYFMWGSLSLLIIYLTLVIVFLDF
jgi:hypothetical protein